MSRPVTPVKTGVSFAEFLEYTAVSQTRCEFVHGEVFEMAGGTDRHNRLAFLLAMRLENGNSNPACRVFLLDLFVRTPNGVGYLPDVFGVCGEDNDEPRVKRRPCFIVEVISASTEAIDRGEKFLNYRLIPELQTYVLLAQDTPRAEVFTRQHDGTWLLEILEGDATLDIACLDASVKLLEVYEAV
jgi:Uma2 family endonuclease